MLNSPRVFLAPLTREDSPILFSWINNPSLMHFSAPYKPVSDIEHEKWFEKMMNDKGSAIHIFGIRTRSDNNLIGSCQLLNINSISKSAELQIRIGLTEEQGKGLGTEALNALIEFGFDTLNLNRIYLYVFASNVRAQKSYQKVGFVQEGILRQAAFISGEYQDVYIMGLLKSDYQRAVNNE